MGAATHACTRCGELKPAGAFTKDKHRPTGLRAQCKQCIREYRTANRDKIKVTQSEYLKTYTETVVCSVCKAPFKTRRGRGTRTCPLPACRSTHLPRTYRPPAPTSPRDLAIAKLKRAAEGTRAGYQWASGCCRECGAHFTAMHSGSMRHLPQLCSDRCKRRERARQRRAREMGVLRIPYSRAEVFRDDNFRCYICTVALTPYDVHAGWSPTMATIDHVVPLCAGGSDTRENVRACCSLCNSTKSGDPL